MRTTFSIAAVALASLLSACATTAVDPTVTRYKIPGSSFPIANAVEVSGGASTVYLSGKVPPMVDKTKPSTDPAAYGGDTEGQTVAVLEAIDAQLKSMDLTMSDVVKMQVFLVKDPAKGGKMDFAGFMKGYTKYFGTEKQPLLPSRSAFEIAALANPAWFVEIEVVAVRGGRAVAK
ncbi:RidA family protein [Pseudorhodoferax soli]|uniref:Enamine deaminase RidA (YjgF/YER057c/UK114 family) n=1 Tax=Pseudorhodoferax soli TaxID=545864 RepID=A0A368XM45_9BURK|nr:RidA family protein [Pseudorhodoferax soli]RCW68619.1 enamine deaminase RidA (YjgF/YER057c/UK114 family) [Pseudorhodoferax soli]